MNFVKYYEYKIKNICNKDFVKHLLCRLSRLKYVEQSNCGNSSHVVMTYLILLAHYYRNRKYTQVSSVEFVVESLME